MHYYTFKPKDYMSKTAFLEPLEDLAYRRMLDHCYLTEKPLPESIEEIAMLIRMRSHTDSIRIVLHYFFELTAEGYINDYVARELFAYHTKSLKAKASADARWKKERNKIKDISAVESQCKSNANALREESESNTNQQPLTNNHKPLTNNIDTPSDKPKRFDFKKALIEESASEDLAVAFMAVRKTKKATNTEKAFDLFMSNVNKSNMSLNQVLEICVQRDWKGFDPTWLNNQSNNRGTDNFHDSFYGVGQSPFGQHDQNEMRDVGGNILIGNDDRRF